MNRIVPALLSASFAALVGCAVQTSPETEATSNPEALTSGKPYLALGDSVAFGYNPVDAVKDPTNLKAFTGYPELTADLGRLSPSPVTSPACPGETSGSFLTYGAPDNGCQGWRAAGYAMHAKYASNSETQLQFALAFLAANPTTTVTLGIGANDLLLVQNACEAKYPVTDPTYVAEVTACEEAQVPGVVEAAAGNIAYVATAIRQSGYTGQLALVTYYAEAYANQADPTYQSVVGLDTAMVEIAQGYPQLNLSIAKGFSAFAAIANATSKGDACKAGLLYKLSDGTCNIHPSTLGQAVLAAAVATAVPASKISLSASPPQF